MKYKISHEAHLPISRKWTDFQADFHERMEYKNIGMKYELWVSIDNQLEEEYWFRIKDILENMSQT